MSDQLQNERNRLVWPDGNAARHKVGDRYKLIHVPGARARVVPRFTRGDDLYLAAEMSDLSAAERTLAIRGDIPSARSEEYALKNDESLQAANGSVCQHSTCKRSSPNILGRDAGKLQMHILGAIAEFERARIVERVRAGLARPTATTIRISRPSITVPAINARAGK